MNHKHRQTLHSIFAHPVSSNLDQRHVYAMLESLGAEVERGGHGHVVIKLNNHTHGFHDAHHTFTKEDVVTLRKFLETAGIDPEKDFPL